MKREYGECGQNFECLEDVKMKRQIRIKAGSVIALAGNPCRCTGYAKIIDAVLAIAEAIRSGSK